MSATQPRNGLQGVLEYISLLALLMCVIMGGWGTAESGESAPMAETLFISCIIWLVTVLHGTWPVWGDRFLARFKPVRLDVPVPNFTGVNVNVWRNGRIADTRSYIAQSHEDRDSIRRTVAHEYGVPLSDVEVLPS